MITQTYNPDAPKRDLEPASVPDFLGLRAPISERSTEFTPNPVPDISSAQAVRLAVRRSLENAYDQDDQLAGRMASLNEIMRQHRTLLMQKTRVEQELREAEAEALADGSVIDSTRHIATIDDLTTRIQISSKDFEGARMAVPLLQSRRDEKQAVITGLRKELTAADTAWLKIRHAQLTEALRLELHGLYRILAKLIAVENAENFKGADSGWRLLDDLNLSIPYRSIFRMDWLNTQTCRSFPGFADATAALEAEMNFDEVAE